MLKRLIPLEKIRRFTLLSLVVSIFAFLINLILSIMQWPEFYYLTIFFMTLADAVLIVIFNVFEGIRDTLKKSNRKSKIVFLFSISFFVAIFIYFYGLAPYSILLSICIVVPVTGGYLYFITYYVRHEKWRTLNRAVQRAGHP